MRIEELSLQEQMFLQNARAAADNSTRKAKHGVMIQLASKHWVVGNNYKRTHPRLAKEGFVDGSDVHAELDAVMRCGEKDTKGAHVYSVRLLSDDTYGLAKPCDACLGLLKRAEVKRIVYTVDEDNCEVIAF